MNNGISLLVHKLRLQRGWSQEQLADLAGLSVRTVQRIERGQAASLETLKSLAAVFEIDLASLQAETDMIPDPKLAVRADEALAFRQVRKLKRFYIHAMQYALVIALLALINYFHSPRYFWVGWVAFGWGMGLLLHALATFELFPFLGPEWEKRQIEKRLGRKL
jgi:transcriptional regulator with XRE-family HTH domain